MYDNKKLIFSCIMTMTTTAATTLENDDVVDNNDDNDNNNKKKKHVWKGNGMAGWWEIKGYSSWSKNLTHNVDDNVVENTTEIVVMLLPFIHNIVGCLGTSPFAHSRPPTLANDDMIKQNQEKKS